MNWEKELFDKVYKDLQDNNITFDTDVGIEGVETDFLIYAPDDRKFVVELKDWKKFEGFTKQAALQTEFYKSNLGVDEAFIVISNLQRSNNSTGVITYEKLIPALLNEFSKVTKEKKKVSPSIQKTPKKEIFAAMPFDPKYEDVYFISMAEAARGVDAVVERVDQVEYSGPIVDKIRSMIENSIAVIADLSESNPNVMYEVGYAHAKRIPTVHLCSTPLKELPFNVSDWNTIAYEIGQTHLLGKKIQQRLEAII